MSHFVVQSIPARLPVDDATQQDVLQQIYSDYSEWYPNPQLQKELQEREELRRAVSAAHTVASEPTEKTGLWNRLFGKNEPENTPTLPTDDDCWKYIDENDNEDDGMLGTTKSLDVSCIPTEANTLARWNMVSLSQSNIVKPAFNRPALVLTGLGQWMEFSPDETTSRPTVVTLDRDQLDRARQSDTDRHYHVRQARACWVGPNLLAASWGLADGLVLLYDQEGRPVALYAPRLSPDAMDDDESLLRVSQVSVLHTTGMKILVVARLNGSLELVPLHEDSFRRGRRLPQLQATTAVSTLEYHVDVMGMTVMDTSRDDPVEWNQEKYPHMPPAQHVVAVFGGNPEGQEVISFWSVASNGHEVMVTLTEAIRINSVGPPLTVLGTPTMFRYWRKPRHVELANADGNQNNSSEQQPPVTCISVPSPIVSLEFWNTYALVRDIRGIAILDCSLLERTASHTLRADELGQVFNDDSVIPLVVTTFDREQILRYLCERNFPQVSAASWYHADSPTLAAVVGKKLNIFTLANIRDSAIPASISLVSSSKNLTGRLVKLNQQLFWCPGTFAASMCSIDRLDLRSMIESMHNEQNYEEALDMARKFSVADQTALAAVLVDCGASLWRKTLNIKYLEELDDGQRVVEEALAFDQYALAGIIPADWDVLYRKVLLLALSKTDSIRLGKSLEMGGIDSVIVELRKCLTEIGTYCLICRHRVLARSIENFFKFRSTDKVLLAKAFARTADINSLTILLFRHFPSLFLSLDGILDMIPQWIDPGRFAHLFPIQGSRFLSGDEEDALMGWEKLPQVATSQLGLHLVFDDDDLKHIVLERNLFEDTLPNGPWNPGVTDWYATRVQYLDRHATSLNLIHDFCSFALLVVDPQSFSANLLRLTMNSVDLLVSTADSLVGVNIRLRDVPDAVVSELDILSEENLEDGLLLVDGAKSSARVFDVINQIGEESCSETLVNHLKSALLGSETVQDMVRQVDVLVSVIRRLEPRSDVGDRLISDSGVVELLRCVYLDVINTEFDLLNEPCVLPQLIRSLWGVYECLPSTSRVVSTQLAADILFREFVSLEVLSQWHCAWQPLLPISSWTLGEPDEVTNIESGVSMLRLLGNSFCSQISSACSLDGTSAEFGLFDALASDISELNRHAFNGLLDIDEVLADSLVNPLLEARRLDLLEYAISKADFFQGTHCCTAIARFIERSLFGRHSSDMRPFAMECCARLTTQISCLATELGPIQRYIDVMHFLDSLSELNLTTIPAPHDVEKMDPLDYIDQVLEAHPQLLVHGTPHWVSEEGSASMNDILRRYQGTYPASHPSLRIPESDLPSLPGTAVVHLGELLKLVSPEEIAVVKCNMIGHALDSHLHGAASALCRELLLWGSDIWDAFGIGRAITDAASSIIAKTEYNDTETKIELCILCLARSLVPFGTETKKSMIALTTANTLEFSVWNSSVAHENLRLPMFHKLCAEIQNEYGTQLTALFASLRHQAIQGESEHSLLTSIARFSFFSCIACGTNLSGMAPALEEFGIASVAVFAGYLLLHVGNYSQKSSQCIDEISRILAEQQGSKALQNYSPNNANASTPDRNIVDQLMGLGYSENGSQRAVNATKSTSISDALQWAVTQSLLPGFDDPLINAKPSLDLSIAQGMVHTIGLIIETISYALLTDQGSVGIVESTLIHGPQNTKSVSLSPPDVQVSLKNPKRAKMGPDIFSGGTEEITRVAASSNDQQGNTDSSTADHILAETNITPYPDPVVKSPLSTVPQPSGAQSIDGTTFRISQTSTSSVELRERGKMLFNSIRSSKASSQQTMTRTSTKERQRLIEEGRRLFRKTRESDNSTRVRSLIAVDDGTVIHSAPPSLGTARQGIVEKPAEKQDDESLGAWDFDEY